MLTQITQLSTSSLVVSAEWREGGGNEEAGEEEEEEEAEEGVCGKIDFQKYHYHFDHYQP